MKKIVIIILLLSVLIPSCEKEDKFPTKKDLQGRWVSCDEINWFYSELVFDNKSVQLLNREENYETCNYRLDISIKKIYFTSGVEEGKIFGIWFNKNTGVLYLEDTYRPQQDLTSPATYIKIE